jgi:polyferredoxin
MGGLQALSSYLVRGSLACSMTSVQIVMGIMLFVGVILISKLFCAFICPLGTIMEWLGKLGDKLGVRTTVSGIADLVLRVIKYVLLFITFYFTVGASELFCKNYDPFFAAVSGYGHDVTTWMAVSATLLVVLGSVFIRMFWCKYICPLGAISNIFKFLITFAGVFGIYFIITYAGAEISWLWPLAITCILSYAFEVVYMKSKLFPAFKITRDEDACVDCGLCSKKCPQAIDVASLKVVKHVDCTLCGECLTACPKEGALTINKKMKSSMIPAIITVLLVAFGIYLGSTMEVATIDEQWGTEQQMENAAVVKNLIYLI